MALTRYRLTQTVTVAEGTPAGVLAGEPGTGGAAGYGNVALAAGQVEAPWGTTFLQGQLIVLDPVATNNALYTALASYLTPYVQAQETGGSIGVSN